MVGADARARTRGSSDARLRRLRRHASALAEGRRATSFTSRGLPDHATFARRLRAVSNLQSASDARGTKAGFARHECGWHERLVNAPQPNPFRRSSGSRYCSAPLQPHPCIVASAGRGTRPACPPWNGEWLVYVMYIPSRPLYQADAERCRVSKGCVLTGRGGFQPPQELRMDRGCQVHSVAAHLPG